MKKIFISGTEGKIIVVISNIVNYTSKISRETRVTYSEILKKCKLLDDAGLITRNKQGRKNIIKLTNKGKEVKELLIKLNELTR